MKQLLTILALVAAFRACPARAADSKLPDVKSFDKTVIDSLRAVHNQGAELYNTSNDYAAAFRLYQGALVAVRPLLAHRPEAQKLIDTGLESAAKAKDIDRKAFLLHETIENVRKQLKIANGFEKGKKPEEKKPEEKKPPAKDDAGSSGTVTVAGKPLAAGELTIVSTTLAVPRVFTTTVKDGAYRFVKAIPTGRYRVIITGEGVPAKYHTVTTSALVLEFGRGPVTIDLNLK